MPRVKSTLNIKYLTEEELKRLFAVISSPRDKAIFRIGYHRGLRAGEVADLQISDYEPESGRLFVHRKKNGDSGIYGLTTIELKSLRAWLKIRGTEAGPIFTSNRGTGISQQMLDVLMKQYCALAHVPPDRAHFHALRHSCGTHLLSKGRDLSEVKEHLGHKWIASTLEYAKITNKHRDRMARELKGWT